MPIPHRRGANADPSPHTKRVSPDSNVLLKSNARTEQGGGEPIIIQAFRSRRCSRLFHPDSYVL